jgi:hypothetical protein
LTFGIPDLSVYEEASANSKLGCNAWLTQNSEELAAWSHSGSNFHQKTFLIYQEKSLL